MKETIELLKNLQEKDIMIFEAKEIIESIPKIINEEEKKIKDLKDYLEKKINNLSSLKKEFRHKERDLAMYEDKIKAFKGRISMVKTKKELDALEEEIKKHEELKEKIEEEGLALMENIEREEREIKEEERKVKINEDLFKKTKEEKEMALKEAEEKYKTSSSLREEISKKIDKRILELYETIRENKDNIALAEVKDGICSVCQMTLRPQIINQIKEEKEIIRCEECLRILYI